MEKMYIKSIHGRLVAAAEDVLHNPAAQPSLHICRRSSLDAAPVTEDDMLITGTC